MDAEVAPLAGIVEVHDVLRGDGHAILRGWPEVPSLQHGKHLLLDTVSDALQQLGLDHVSFCVNRDLDNHVALNARRYVRARYRRIGKDLRSEEHTSELQSLRHLVC